MKKTGMIIFTFCLLFISCRPLINPIDPKSDDYIGYESIDNDGDGIGQYFDVDEIEPVSPEEGALFTNTTTPTLKVNKMDPDTVIAYQFQISENSNFSTLVDDFDPVSTYAFTVPPGTLENNTTYYWRAIAFDGTKWSDDWTEARSFAIDIDTNVPILQLPENGGDIENTTPELEWINVDTAVSYEVQISEESNFSPIHETASELDESEYQMTIPLANNTKYYWRARIYIEGDIAGQWSETWSFTVDMEKPISPSPANGGRSEYTTPLLNWGDVASADSYEIQISTIVDFSTTLETVSGLEESEYQMTEVLANNTTYYWRVRIRDENNVTGDWSSWSFTVDMDEPTNPSPADLGTTADPTPLLEWDDVPSAASYEVEISAASNFSPTLETGNGLVSSQYQMTGVLANNTTYYWRVRIRDENNLAGDWSSWSFTVNVTLGVPINPDPSDSSSTIDTTPLLNWDDVASAASYEVEISTDAGFLDIVESADEFSISEYQMTEVLANNTTYYWRVRAYNEYDAAGEWSATWSFAVDMEEPANPVPADLGTTADPTPLLEWDDVPSAASYDVEISAASNFSPTLETGNGLVSSQYQMTGVLANNTTYYWRVRIRDGNNVAGDWSSWSFTVNVTLGVPTNPDPPDSSSTIDTTPLLNWDDVTSAASYEIQISTVDDFSTTLESGSSLVSSQYQMTEVLANNTTYYWRVRAYNEYDAAGEWSATWSFAVDMEEPANPVPADLGTTADTTPLLEWDDVTSAASYDVEISADAGFSGIVESADGFSISEYQIAVELTDGTYYWRVRIYNVDGVAGDFSTWSFTVDTGGP